MYSMPIHDIKLSANFKAFYFKLHFVSLDNAIAFFLALFSSPSTDSFGHFFPCRPY